MSGSHVLRIPRLDDDDGSSFVLVHVTPSSARKARLDVKVVATEGEYPYVVSLKHAAIAALKAPGSPCSADEWEAILESVLLESHVRDDILLTAAVRSGLEITVRKKVQRITQRLGTITLKKDENEDDSDVTEWCGVAIEARDALRVELASARAKAQELEQAVSALSSQLEELIGNKRDHEATLLHKFRALLNEKKAKIREQEDIIRHAKLDTASLAPAQSSRYHSAEPASISVASRRSKRKSPPNSSSAGDISDDGRGLGMMSSDRVKHEEKDGGYISEDQHTSEDDADATASETDDESRLAKADNVPDKQGSATAVATGLLSKSPVPPASGQMTAATSHSRRVADSGLPQAQQRVEAASETESDDEL